MIFSIMAPDSVQCLFVTFLTKFQISNSPKSSNTSNLKLLRFNTSPSPNPPPPSLTHVTSFIPARSHSSCFDTIHLQHSGGTAQVSRSTTPRKTMTFLITSPGGCGPTIVPAVGRPRPKLATGFGSMFLSNGCAVGMLRNAGSLASPALDAGLTRA